jgi:pyridoxal phosphate enzyme (YggS family)
MTPSPAESIAQGIAETVEAIARAAADAGRDPADVRLIAVAKTHGPEAVEAALGAGQRRFGENRVQEAAGKYPAFRAGHPDLELHLIGPLQTNKARQAIGLFDVIQTVDRPKLAEALAAEMAAAGRRPRCLIQVNTGDEPQKAGISPAEADAFIADCRDRLGLPVTGLMCIPPADEPPAPHFALLREIARRNNLAELSMGMSADYPVAVALGATSVRVGTAIFGRRPPPAAV